MADVGNLHKLVRNPQRLMGAKSTDVEGPILYFEFGTFTVADNVTSSTLPTDLTNVSLSYFQPLNAYAITGAAWSTNVITTATIPVSTTDPGGTANYAYLLIGSVETV